jgi:cell division protein FtsW
MAMFFVAGADWRQFLVLMIFGALAGLFVVVVIRYNLARWIAFRQDLFADVEGTNHQVVQSIVALYRGGLAGIGLGMSEQKFLIYAAHTDCVIAVIGEELGFLGTSVMVVLYGLWTWRGLRVAAVAPDAYGGLLAIGIVIWITLQAALHVAVGTATTPFTGTVLPMVSYGGSSMVTSLGAVGILLNISHAGRAAR